jgi:folate-binding protein YgfZ
MHSRFVPLHDYVCLAAEGRDVRSFLHAQLTQSIDSLPSNRAPLAAWCDARGRVLALLRVVPTPHRWLLVTPRDGADALLSRLRKFVLRADVTLALSDDLAVGALVDVDADSLAARGLANTEPDDAHVERSGIHWIRVGDTLWWAVAPVAEIDALAASAEPTRPDSAALAEIALGLPAITAAASGRYVAQMLNLDRLGAIVFDKGCYPGQEIVARVQHLGDVKRRLRRFATTASKPPAEGASVTANGTAVGEVIRAAATPSGADLLAVVEVASAGTELTCDGAPLRELPIAYPPENPKAVRPRA